jgi:DNA-binding NarL/FixJ family response regulator
VLLADDATTAVRETLRHGELTRREVEIVTLVAQGKSNREIADALFISRNTVPTHVRNILTKTGCTNRTEAATYALRHGLSEA